MTPSFAATALALSAIAGAPRTPYGGEVVALVWGDAPILDPAEVSTAAELCATGAVFEPLYERGPKDALIPVLAAGPPALEGRTLVVRIRPGVVLHDGSTLTAEHVAASLRRLADPSRRGHHVVFPISGVRRRLLGDPGAQLEIATAGDTVRIELAAPYAEAARLLASPRAGIAVASRPGLAGTGAFAIATTSPLALVPHLQHRRGRPFLDRLLFAPASTTFGARASLRRGEATLVFGLADLDLEAAREARGVSSRVDGSAPELQELVVLAVGRSATALRDRAALDSMSAALNRARLAQRYLPGDGRPADTLLGKEPSGPSPPLRRTERARASLLIAPERAPGLPFAERVQLDLLRAGVTAVIERVTAAELLARRKSGDFDLLLDTVLLEPGPLHDAADELHAITSIAAWAGAPATLPDDVRLAAFAAAPERGRRTMVREIERALRDAAGLVPIAVRRQPIWMRPGLEASALDAAGVLRLEDAYLPGSRAK